MIKKFSIDELEPTASENDESQSFNESSFKKLGELGLLGITADPEFGGSGMDVVSATIAMEEMGAVCASTTLSYLAHSILAANNLSSNGSKEQKQKYLPDLCSGKTIGAMCMSEPGAGSDALGMQTKAEKTSKGYLLNGTKMWITNGPYADFFWVYARTGPNKKDISTFIVEKTFSGFKIGNKLNKFGMRASPTSEIIFEDCLVPLENLVGKENDSISHMMNNLLIERVTISGISLGLSRAAIEYCTQYCKDRKQFNQPLIEFQMVEKTLADATAEYIAARCLTYEAAAAIDAGKNDYAHLVGTSAKLIAAISGTKICLDAIQVLGGYGFTKEYPVERYLRDAKLIEIGAGTNEVMRLIIGKWLRKNTSFEKVLG